MVFMQRVLDTAALLHWPVHELEGGVCAVSQRRELERLSPPRLMLVETVDLVWRDVTSRWLDDAKLVASQTGDLPRLSDVDLDVLALALGLGVPLVTDDYRLQNSLQHAGGSVVAVANAPATAVWLWELRCTGCRDVSEVTEGAQRSKGQPVRDCQRCGSPMVVKRKRG